MEYKKIFGGFLAVLLGIGIVRWIFEFILVLSFTLLIIFGQKIPEDKFLFLFYIFIGMLFFIFIAGIYLGLRSYKRKDIWYDIFRPSEISCLLSLILSVIGILIGYTILDVSPPMLKILEYLIIGFVIFYPFSALCIFIYENRNERIFRDSMVVVIVLLIIFNPVFIFSGRVYYNSYSDMILEKQCAVTVQGFYTNSPAEESGMHIGEVIYSINDVNINSVDRLDRYMESYNSPKELTIHTLRGSYSVMPMLKDGKYTLGVNATQYMCLRYEKLNSTI